MTEFSTILMNIKLSKRVFPGHCMAGVGVSRVPFLQLLPFRRDGDVEAPRAQRKPRVLAFRRSRANHSPVACESSGANVG